MKRSELTVLAGVGLAVAAAGLLRISEPRQEHVAASLWKVQLLGNPASGAVREGHSAGPAYGVVDRPNAVRERHAVGTAYGVVWGDAVRERHAVGPIMINWMPNAVRERHAVGPLQAVAVRERHAVGPEFVLTIPSAVRQGHAVGAAAAELAILLAVRKGHAVGPLEAVAVRERHAVGPNASNWMPNAAREGHGIASQAGASLNLGLAPVSKAAPDLNQGF